MQPAKMGRSNMVDHELDELKREFLAEAEDKVREIASALDDGSPESLQRLAYLAHQLKGSGGSYGYQRISQEAAEVEKVVESMLAGANGSALTGKVRQHVTGLSSEIGTRMSELATR